MSKQIKDCLRLFLVVFVFGLNGCTPVNPSPIRAGIGLSTAADVRLWGERLGADWYYDWSSAPDDKNGLERWQMVRVSLDGFRPGVNTILQVAKRNRGDVWMIGNEPDNIAQDGVDADRYAEVYHELYQLIKKTDPSAKVAVGGVTQPSALRMKYLDQVLAAYRARYGAELPTDWWTVHGYVLNEASGEWGAGIPVGLDEETGIRRVPEEHGNIALFQQQIVDFREWMQKNGYQNIPLAITEFGVLLPVEEGYSQEFVAQYLLQTCAWLDVSVDQETGYAEDGFRLVQRWAWFSLSDPLFPGSNLVDLELNRLTPAGEAFRVYTRPSE